MMSIFTKNIMTHKKKEWNLHFFKIICQVHLDTVAVLELFPTYAPVFYQSTVAEIVTD